MIGSTGNLKAWAAVIIAVAIAVAAAVALSMALADDAEARRFVTKTKTFSSTEAISFPGPGTGPANPYPSTIPVSFKPGSLVADVNLTLHDFQSDNPDDVAVMVARGQRNQGVLADAGGSMDLFDISITFDDEAPIRASDENFIGAPGQGVNVVVQPSRYGADWPVPAPSALSVFDGMNPTGTWGLFVVDDGFGSDPFSIDRWSLTIRAKVPAPTVAPAKTTLTIRAEGVDLSGTVQSSRLSCVDGRNIKLYKQQGTTQNPSTDTLIGQDTSERQGDHGVWSTGNTGMSGKFYVRTKEVPGCTGAASQTITARR